MTNNQVNYFSETNKEKWNKLDKRKVYIINTQWNDSIIKSLTDKTIELLDFSGFKDYEEVKVAGAYEIPYMASLLAKKDPKCAIVTLGCVIKGETYHFNAIVDAVSENLMDVSIKTGVPIAFGVLTVNNEGQAKARSGDNEFNKGLEATAALLDLIETIQTRGL